MTTQEIRVTGQRRAEVDVDRLTAAFLTRLAETLAETTDESGRALVDSPAPGGAS